MQRRAVRRALLQLQQQRLQRWPPTTHQQCAAISSGDGALDEAGAASGASNNNHNNGAAAAAAAAAAPKNTVTSTFVGGRRLSWESGRLARLAHGSCVARYGGTVVLSTVVVDGSEAAAAAAAGAGGGDGGAQLQVEFLDRAYAYGRIPTRADRRDAAGSDRETLAARAVDRALRPLVPPGLAAAVQVVNTVLAADGAVDPEVLAINAASAALLRSGLPWGGPVA